MGHDHGHDHTHSANKKTLIISFIIITGYMIIEAIGGFITNSLALLSDAGHMLSDSISLGIALLAFTLAGKAANQRKTYGYKRFEILDYGARRRRRRELEYARSIFARD